jgi:hypothetical protein
MACRGVGGKPSLGTTQYRHSFSSQLDVRLAGPHNWSGHEDAERNSYLTGHESPPSVGYFTD